ncbi:MAG: aminoacyl-tRNA hydrolase [Phycisphaerae bacterium]|nr:aminoacyl-tRNA hydrolase [Phycisphaerae bacterium]
MKLIVGLGNPGREYQQTRHNIGFMVVDRLVHRHGLGEGRSKFHAEVYEGRIAATRAMLIKPMTYMNRSGLAVGEAVRFFKLEPADLLVVVDDTALPLGTLRLRPEGSDGGHRGLADIARGLGTRDYPRLRFGVGAARVGEHRIPLTDHVLGRFTDAEQDELAPALDRAAEAVETFLDEGLDSTMNRFNRREREAADRSGDPAEPDGPKRVE